MITFIRKSFVPFAFLMLLILGTTLYFDNRINVHSRECIVVQVSRQVLPGGESVATVTQKTESQYPADYSVLVSPDVEDDQPAGSGQVDKVGKSVALVTSAKKQIQSTTVRF